MAYIIKNISHKEINILEDRGINWYPYHFVDGDNNIAIDEKQEFEKVLKLLGR